MYRQMTGRLGIIRRHMPIGGSAYQVVRISPAHPLLRNGHAIRECRKSGTWTAVGKHSASKRKGEVSENRRMSMPNAQHKARPQSVTECRMSLGRGLSVPKKRRPIREVTGRPFAKARLLTVTPCKIGICVNYITGGHPDACVADSPIGTIRANCCGDHVAHHSAL
jgi:hypothetical protein